MKDLAGTVTHGRGDGRGRKRWSLPGWVPRTLLVLPSHPHAGWPAPLSPPSPLLLARLPPSLLNAEALTMSPLSFVLEVSIPPL